MPAHSWAVTSDKGYQSQLQSYSRAASVTGLRDTLQQPKTAAPPKDRGGKLRLSSWVRGVLEIKTLMSC